jgi:hypothetical protein
MIVEEVRWSSDAGWTPRLGRREVAADLVLYFGSRTVLESADRYEEMRSAYPEATIVGCSGTRTIVGSTLEEDVVVAVALCFTRTTIRMARAGVTDPSQSRAAGRTIGEALVARDLAGVIVLADGLMVDGSDFMIGFNDVVGAGPLVVGGMASDPRDYRQVLVGADCAPQGGTIAAVGFYGDAIRFGHGRSSGWEPFGPRRRVTRSQGNVLFDLDGKPAYELYERYLGDEILGKLASESVVFPMQIAPPDHPESVLVRAPLAVDEGPASMTFAGHVPQGWIARLLRGSVDRLILAAADAARRARCTQPQGDTLNFIVSCAGRHQMMGQRTEEELEVAITELGSAVASIGFYSYGEIAPVGNPRLSDVHNQSICITSIMEAEH